MQSKRNKNIKIVKDGIMNLDPEQQLQQDENLDRCYFTMVAILVLLIVAIIWNKIVKAKNKITSRLYR